MKKTMRKQKGCPQLLLFQTSQLLMMKTSCFKNSKVIFIFLISHSISFVSDSQAIEGDDTAGNDVNKSDIEADNDNINNGGEANSGNARHDTRSMSVYTGTKVKNIYS